MISSKFVKVCEEARKSDFQSAGKVSLKAERFVSKCR